jgi:hypothetical protein
LKRWRGKSNNMKTRFVQWAGYALAVVAFLLVIGAALTYSESQGSELRTPLPLAVGRQITRQFRTRTDGVYLVEIDLKRNLPFAQLQHFLAKPPPVSWSVQSAGKSVGKPMPVGKPLFDAYWSGDFGYTVGQFHAERGRIYRVQAGFQQTSPTLALLNPNLQVELSPVQMEQKGFQTVRFLVGALLVFALAALLTVVGNRIANYAE